MTNTHHQLKPTAIKDSHINIDQRLLHGLAMHPLTKEYPSVSWLL